jgi:hypothetical protein
MLLLIKKEKYIADWPTFYPELKKIMIYAETYISFASFFSLKAILVLRIRNKYLILSIGQNPSPPL